MELLLGIAGLIALAAIGYFLYRFLVGIFSIVVIVIAGILGIALIIYIIGQIFSGIFVSVLPLIQLIC